jgi:hypothetical protein
MSDDIASLGFDLDTQPLVASATAIDKLAASSKTAETAVQQLGQAHAAGGTQARALVTATDQVNAAAAKHAATAAAEAGQITTLSRATSVFVGQMEEHAASLGNLGGYLSAFGLAGVAAAAGVAIVVESVRALIESANRMGEFARQLSDSAQTIGVDTDQLQALNKAAAEAGISADANTMAFGRFTVQLNELRGGAGTLFTELHKVTPELVDQLAATKDTASAIDLLAKAYAGATDQAQKNAIARAAFGRSGLNEGRALTNIYDAGGVNALLDAQNKVDIITKEQIPHWKELGIEIEHATMLAKNNMASIFTGPVLEAEAKFAEVFLEISRDAKVLAAINWREVFGVMFGGVPALRPTSGARGGDAGGLSSGLSTLGPSAIAGGAGVPNNVGTIPAATAAAEMKLWVAAMGSAVTVQEQLKFKLLELMAAYEKNELHVKGNTEAQDRLNLNRAQGAASLESEIQIESRRLGLLGQSASIQESVAQKIRDVTKARMEGIPLSAAEEATIRRLATANALGTMAMIAQADAHKIEAAAIGLPLAALTAFTLVQTRLAEARRVGQTLSAAQIADLQREAQAASAAAAALERVKIASEVRFERATVFLSPEDVAIAQRLKSLYGDDFPKALASSEAAALRLNAGLKQVSDAAGTFASGFATEVSHGVTAMTALNNQLKRLSDILIDMISKRLMAQALGMLLPTTGLSTAAIGGGAVGGSVGHSGGIIGADRFPIRYIHSAYFDDAPRFQGGGIVGGERAVIAHDEEGIFTPGQMAALGRGRGGGTVNNLHFHGAPEISRTEQRPNGMGGTDMHVFFQSAVRATMIDDISSNGPVTRAHAQRFGLDPTRGVAV